MVSFLSQVPDQHGQPALHYILREWTSQHVRYVTMTTIMSLYLSLSSHSFLVYLRLD